MFFLLQLYSNSVCLDCAFSLLYFCNDSATKINYLFSTTLSINIMGYIIVSIAKLHQFKVDDSATETRIATLDASFFGVLL